MQLYFRERELVLPGQLLSDDERSSGEGTYARDGKVYSCRIGLATLRDGQVNVIPINAPYKPMDGDHVVGVVVDVKANSVDVDLGGSMIASLRMPEGTGRTPKLNVGDVMYARIRSAGLKGIFLDESERLVKLERGILLDIRPSKVARLIGKRRSMINLLKRGTDCNFYVGRNGLLVISGKTPEQEFLAISAINMVRREAHSSGLTERVAEFLRFSSSPRGG